MKALRENDMEAYAALLAETKNDRLQTLLNQTEVRIGKAMCAGRYSEHHCIRIS